MIDNRPNRKRFVRGAASAAVALTAMVRARRAMAADATPSPDSTPSAVLLGKDKWLFPAWDNLKDAQDTEIQTQLDLIVKTRDLFASKGIAMMIVAVPMKERYTPNLLPDGTVISPEALARYGKIMGYFAERKLLSVDLNAAIAPMGSVPGQTVFWATDQHWTSWSAEAAGAAIADFITKNVQLPKANGPGSKLNPFENEKRLGDLTLLLPKPMQAQYGMQTYVVREPQGSDLQHQNDLGNDLLVPDPTVRLVGSSFSRPDWGLPQKISNALARPVGLTWLRADTGPWRIMLNYVESPDFKKKPTLIVWQWLEGELPLGPTAPYWWFPASQMAPDVWLSRMTAAVKALP